jgi:hypothetical protein
VKVSPVKPPGNIASKRATCSSKVMLGGAIVRTRGFFGVSGLILSPLIRASRAVASSPASWICSSFSQKALAIEWLRPSSKS